MVPTECRLGVRVGAGPVGGGRAEVLSNVGLKEEMEEYTK